jgi:hypothetical protein
VVSFFKEKSGAAIFWLIGWSILLHSQFLIHSPQVVLEKDNGLLYYILLPFTSLQPLAIGIVCEILIIVQALRLNYILNDARMFTKATFSSAMAYVLLTALFPQWNNLTETLLCNGLLIWLVQRFIKLYNTTQPRTAVFNTGFLVSCTVLLYHPVVMLVLVCFFALAILRAFKLKEWLVLFFGMSTPFYFLLAFVFLKNDWHFINGFLPVFHPHLLNKADRYLIFSTSATAGLLIIMGIIAWQNNIGRMIIQVRKNWYMLLLMLLCLVPVIFLFNNTGYQTLLLATVPATGFAACIFFYPKKNLFPVILFWLVVGVVIYNNWWLAKI